VHVSSDVPLKTSRNGRTPPHSARVSSIPPKRREERAAQYRTRAYREVQSRVAANVHRLRDAYGWTQDAAARACGLGLRLYQRLEHAETNATFTTLARLVEGFEVDPLELLRKPRARR
jgi:ribosome-binding protein aMBF1 (putative translation factor)